LLAKRGSFCKNGAVPKNKNATTFANYDMKLLWKQDLWPNVPHKFTKAKLISKQKISLDHPFHVALLKKTHKKGHTTSIAFHKNCIESKGSQNHTK
jgi:hypothetical protein